MRNSFSLSVYPLLVLRCDVTIVFKTVTASGKMKLIPLIVLTINLAVDIKAHEHFTFPPKFQQTNLGAFSADNSLYLPPETHTTLPYFTLKNHNLPFPYLPPVENKAPVLFSTPFPIIMSSTLLPSFDNDEEDDDDDSDDKEKPNIGYMRNKFNRTERTLPQKVEKRDVRAIPKSGNQQHPIDRIDMKMPYPFTVTNANAINMIGQTPTPRNLIISAEHRNDRIDQLKSAFQPPQYLPTPGVFISSTTETAIPILRLSNEMDLDGSFSYEALGADQTHYVQHSRMENTGTDKEEQIVEGSYSYVGDNGQTYTVHYVADSNGFRASGDHLPVAPPIPEIIQRSVQYNLAEEAKKPPHLKSWQNDEKENEVSESEKSHRFAISPPRNLFTGKTPESFSFGFSQGSNIQNNLVSAASSQTPVQSSVDYTSEQLKSKINSGTISPQITFLASQGAHIPSANTPQALARTFTTERPTMPQLINYEAGNKDTEQDSNKGLWRWQYGLNVNSNQNSEKNTISRSSGDPSDDIMINFGDMTHEQYAKMIHSELEPSTKDNDYGTIKHDQIFHNNFNSLEQTSNKPVLSTENIISSTLFENWYKFKSNPDSNQNNYQSTEKQIEKHETSPNTRSNLVTHHEFIPHSQTVTQSYDYEDNYYEPTKIKKTQNKVEEAPKFVQSIPTNMFHRDIVQNNWPVQTESDSKAKITTTEVPVLNSTLDTIKFTDFMVKDNKNNFKPIVSATPTMEREEQTSTERPEDMYKENIFLNHLFNNNKYKQNTNLKEENSNHYDAKTKTVPQPDMTPKFIQYQPNRYNEIKVLKNKPIDISDLLSVISSKNNFESSKIKPKNKFGGNHFNQRSEIRFIPVPQEVNEENKEERPENTNSFRTLNRHQQEELRGIIKNYKVLQRNNNLINNHDNNEQLRRDLSPPPAKIMQPSNLPPLGRAGPSVKSYLPPIYV